RGKRISGRVVDAGGSPVPSAKVTLSGWAQGRGQRTMSGSVDGAGKFEFKGLDEAKWTVEASASGYANATKADLDPGAEGVELTLARAGSVKGRAVTGDPPIPIGNFTIEAEARDEDRGGAGGGFRFRMPGGASRKISDPGGSFS